MEFRQAKISDLDQIMEIIELSKKYLKETKVDQWQDGYPAKEDLRRDIESGNSYVLTNKDEIVATTVISLMVKVPIIQYLMGNGLLMKSILLCIGLLFMKNTREKEFSKN